MIIDIIAGVIVLASVLIAFMRGFIREVLTIAGVVGGIVAAVFFGPKLAPTVRGWYGVVDGEDGRKLFDTIPMAIVADATTYGIIFIAVVIILSLASHFISGAAKAVGLGPVDRTLGVFFGVARALVFLGLLYLPFQVYMSEKQKEEVLQPYVKDSKIFFFIEKTTMIMVPYLHLPESSEIQKGAEEQFKKKLEEQNLLGTGAKPDDTKEDPAKPSDTTVAPSPAPADGTGYKDDQRERLDKLFNEPAGNQ